jgi:hypothetical protein
VIVLILRTIFDSLLKKHKPRNPSYYINTVDNYRIKNMVKELKKQSNIKEESYSNQIEDQ